MEPIARVSRYGRTGHRDMTRNPDKFWHDAVHEAGHAVIARALGVSSGYANLSDDRSEQRSGEAFILEAMLALEWNRRGMGGAFRRGSIIASMAGTEAERQIIGSSLRRYHQDGRSSELDFDVPGCEDDQRAERLRRFARQLVKRHRNAILSFAEQLVAAADLDELLAR